MFLKKIIFITLFISTTILFSQSTIGINVNDEDFEVEGSVDISDYGNGTIFMINANFIETKFNSLAGFGLTANNSFQGLEGLNLSLGINLILLENYGALPLMIKASYILPLIQEIPTISVSAKFAYAPSVLSFDEADDYFEFRTEASMEMINAVSVYLGYRDIEAGYTTLKSDTFNDSFYGGLKLSF
ncbi:hypothetical protein MNB_SV-9-668 [hydrothermal vent metagenome]|uniref:Outer membrane protein beta-barrel domain-containing protein n=1 Tax=hydrothermal vent metagenome TaxID=652676 RepID=A0A1W1BKH3_9ZZZZ